MVREDRKTRGLGKWTQKKIMSYARSVLALVLVVYLILIWMYFKDNAQQLTSASLFIWFVINPLLLLGLLLAARWGQKRLETKTTHKPNTTHQKQSVESPVSYKLFMYSSLCLPEGDSWSDVVDNDTDLTVLSDTLVDFDGLPILTKPIARLADAAFLPYDYMYDPESSDIDVKSAHDDFSEVTFDDDSHTERTTDISSLNLRLCALIHEQLSLSEEILSSLAEHFNRHYQQAIHEPNSALHIHPDWHQRYLVSADEHDDDHVSFASSSPSLSELPIYLCLPASADAALLTAAVKEQLATYGISASLLSITPIITNNVDIQGTAEHDDPIHFVDEQLLSLSESPFPKICLLIIADSQINEAWLELHLDASGSSNIIPTEASVLLVFCNQAAQHVLDIDTNASFLLTKIDVPDIENQNVKGRGVKNTDANINSHPINRRSYLNTLKTIENLLLDHLLFLSSANKEDSQGTQKTTTETIHLANDNIRTNVLPYETSITILSDINPLKQPYNISVFMDFTEAFIEQGAIVNDYSLGHYMPSNNWLKSFISLSLFVDLVEKERQNSNILFLITQHKQCSFLWLADFSQTS